MKKLLTILALMLVAFTANAQIAKWMKPSKVSSAILKGDTNGDGEITVADVMLTVNYALGKQGESFNAANADANGDGEITIADVMGTVSTILEGNGGNGGDTSQVYLTCPDDNHPHMIDLGLPSGTLWACCNVGATKPEGYGGYYAWGEITTKTEYTNETYLYGFSVPLFDTIAMDIAGTDYDVAHVRWGGSWVMPSKEQFEELLNNCTTQWTTQYGVEGRTFTGPSGATIFLPAAGCLNDPRHDIQMPGIPLYWSSTVEKRIDPPDMGGETTYTCAYYLGNNQVSGGEADGFRRYYGLTVRPVSR